MTIILSLFLLGISFGWGPCLASCGPLVISYTVGTQKNITESLAVYLLFSLARISVYVVLGVAVFFVGQAVAEISLGRYSRYVYYSGGALVIFLGALTIAGRFSPWRVCQFLHTRFLAQDKKSIVLLGIMLGLLPCAPLLGLFGYSGLAAKTPAVAALYALAFGIGTAVSPLGLAVAVAGVIPRVLRDSQAIQRIFRIACGLIMVILGLQLVWQGR